MSGRDRLSPDSFDPHRGAAEGPELAALMHVGLHPQVPLLVEVPVKERERVLHTSVLFKVQGKTETWYRTEHRHTESTFSSHIIPEYSGWSFSHGQAPPGGRGHT